MRNLDSWFRKRESEGFVALGLSWPTLLVPLASPKSFPCILGSWYHAGCFEVAQELPWQPDTPGLNWGKLDSTVLSA
jgi:hypothetical protein